MSDNTTAVKEPVVTIKNFRKVTEGFAKLDADFGPVTVTLRVNESKNVPGTYRVNVPASKSAKSGKWFNECFIRDDVYKKLCEQATELMKA